MRVLDLFSGIGGFSLALRRCCQTVAYCEIDDHCQAILKERMKHGDLDEAEILPDIRKIETMTMRYMRHLKPEGITMGQFYSHVRTFQGLVEGLAYMVQSLQCYSKP